MHFGFYMSLNHIKRANRVCVTQGSDVECRVYKQPRIAIGRLETLPRTRTLIALVPAGKFVSKVSAFSNYFQLTL